MFHFQNLYLYLIFLYITFENGNYLRVRHDFTLFNLSPSGYPITSFLLLKMQSALSESSADLEGSRRDERDVVVVQRERLERGKGTEGPL